jgi:hypothetical protein
MARMIDALTAMLASKRAPTIVAARMAFLDGHAKWGCSFRTTVGENMTNLHVFQIARSDLMGANWLARHMNSRVKPVQRYRNGIKIRKLNMGSRYGLAIVLGPILVAMSIPSVMRSGRASGGSKTLLTAMGRK